MTPWPVAWFGPFPPDADRLGVWLLRLLGAMSLVLFVFALLAVGAIVDALTGPSSGWEGLIVGAAVLVGGGCLLAGAGLSAVVHRAVRAMQAVPCERDVVARLGWGVSLLGTVAAAWLAYLGLQTPLEAYTLVLALGVAVPGAVLGRRFSRNRSPPA